MIYTTLLQPVRKISVLVLTGMLFLAGCGSEKEQDTSNQTEGFYELIQVNEGDTVTEQEEIDILKEAGLRIVMLGETN